MNRFKKITTKLEGFEIISDRTPSLDGMTKALKRLKLLIPPENVILIAGTNGKGTTAATLEGLLISAGESVGLYTSPHLVDVRERIRLNGEDVSEDLFCEAFEFILDHTQGITLTHFEILTLMAAWIFFESSPRSRAIFEVGLGGKWDATNAIPHLTSVFSVIDYDHQDLLGADLTSIASNKFGILSNRESQVIVHAPFQPEVDELFWKTTSSLPTNTRIVSVSPSQALTISGRPPLTYLKSPWGEARLSLCGKRAAENTLLALSAFHALGYPVADHLGSLSKLRWPGRFEWIESAPCPHVFSGDHNVSGVESLTEILSKTEYDTVWILAGIGQKKDHRAMIDRLESIPRSKLVLTETPYLGRKLAKYGKSLKKAHFSHSNPFQCLSWIQERASAKDLILITGSLYLVGQIKREWVDNGFDVVEQTPLPNV